MSSFMYPLTGMLHFRIKKQTNKREEPDEREEACFFQIWTHLQI